MGLFGKKDKLSKFEVDANSEVEKFEYQGKFYDLQEYVHAKEMAARDRIQEDHVKTIKNRQKTEKAYIAHKTAVNYIDYAIAKQLVDKADKVKISAVDVKYNTKE